MGDSQNKGKLYGIPSTVFDLNVQSQSKQSVINLRGLGWHTEDLSTNPASPQRLENKAFYRDILSNFAGEGQAKVELHPTDTA